jgi:CPA1 family monovalent cation:H+ antiporter
MSPAGRFEVLLGLMTLVIVLELIARRLRLPPAGTLILGGIALALVPGTPDFAIDPELVLVLFLPPLLLAGAYFTAWRDFKADLRVILQLAVGAVGFTTLAVGVVAHLVVPSLPWAAAFALGAIVSPPDAVAAKAVLQNLRLPQRMNVLLEGESLVNDATGLVLFRFAVLAGTTGHFSAAEASLAFVVLAAGGVAAGLAFGAIGSRLIARLHDPILAIAASFILAWASYIVADGAGVSGVLSTVTCGLVMGWRQHTVLDAVTRMQARAAWDVIVFILESMVFILIGLSLRGVVARLGGWGAALDLLPATGAIVAAVIVSRFVWIIPAAYLTRFLFPRIRAHDPYPPLAIPIVMSWAGMRGVVSLAAALTLPEPFPGRDFILGATFLVILVTVLVQGATLESLIRALHVAEFAGGREPKLLSEAAARARIAAAQFAAVQEEARAEEGSPSRHPRLLEQYEYRARAAARFSQSEAELSPDREEHFRVVLAAVAAGREELLRLHRRGEIHDTVLHALEQELDLEEMSARRYAGASSEHGRAA